MEREFNTSIGFKIFYGALAFGLIIFSVYLLANTRLNPNGAGIFISIMLLPTALAIMINLYKRKVVFSENTILSISIWGNKELYNTDVKGFRLGEKAIYIEPREGYSKVTIRDYLSLENTKELIGCLKARYTDLNAEDYDKALEEILGNSDLGISTDERTESLKNAKQVSFIYNIGGFALFWVALLIFKHNQIVDFIVLLFPPAGVLIICLSKGLIRLITKKSSAHYHVFLGIYMPVIVLSIKSLVDYHIFQYDHFWPPFIVISFLLFIVLCAFSIRKSNTLVAGQLFLAVFIAIAYGYGSIIRINCNFDNSKPTVYSPIVIDKHITGDKKNNYRVILSAWGTKTHPDNIQVSDYLYHNVTIGGTVHVYLKRGLLNVPWYYIKLY